MPATPIEKPFKDVNWATHVVLQSAESADHPIKYYQVPRKGAEMSAVAKELIEEADEGAEVVIPVVNVNGTTLAYVADYMDHHAENRMDELPKPLPAHIRTLVSEWDKNFLYTDLVRGGNERDHDLLVDVMMAANYLNCRDLLNLTCAACASIMEGKTADEIRDIFNIENDFSPEEYKKITEEMKWCLEAEKN